MTQIANHIKQLILHTGDTDKIIKLVDCYKSLPKPTTEVIKSESLPTLTVSANPPIGTKLKATKLKRATIYKSIKSLLTNEIISKPSKVTNQLSAKSLASKFNCSTHLIFSIARNELAKHCTLERGAHIKPYWIDVLTPRLNGKLMYLVPLPRD